MNEFIQWFFILLEAEAIVFAYILMQKKIAEEETKKEKAKDPWQSLLDENGRQIGIPDVYCKFNPATGETETYDPFNLLGQNNLPKEKRTR